MDGSEAAIALYVLVHVVDVGSDITGLLGMPIRDLRPLVPSEIQPHLKAFSGSIAATLGPSSTLAATYQKVRRKLEAVSLQTIGRAVNLQAIERTPRKIRRIE